MRSKIEKYGRARQATDNLIRRMSLVCQVNKARIQTRSQYLILIAFPQQEWLHESSVLLRPFLVHYCEIKKIPE